jgi:TRAP-type C4-dicarboxylate transport system permease small subunit
MKTEVLMRKKLILIIDNIEEIVLSGVFVVMVVSVIFQIVSRYIFSRPLVFTEELSRSSYVWICFLGMGIATKRELHIRIDLLAFILKGKIKIALDLVVNIISVGLYALLIYIGINYTWAIRMQITPAMEIPRAIITISLPIGATVSLIRIISLIKRDVVQLKAKQ